MASIISDKSSYLLAGGTEVMYDKMPSTGREYQPFISHKFSEVGVKIQGINK